MNKKNLKKIFFPLKTGRNRFFHKNETASSPLNPMEATSGEIIGVFGEFPEVEPPVEMALDCRLLSNRSSPGFSEDAKFQTDAERTRCCTECFI